MKKDYTFMYKCRLCGETHTGSMLTSEDSGPAATHLRNSFSKVETAPEIKPFRVHLCKNGDVGVSDLQGAVVTELE